MFWNVKGRKDREQEVRDLERGMARMEKRARRRNACRGGGEQERVGSTNEVVELAAVDDGGGA
jgi:hypothetical protein